MDACVRFRLIKLQLEQKRNTKFTAVIRVHAHLLIYAHKYTPTLEQAPNMDTACCRVRDVISLVGIAT